MKKVLGLGMAALALAIAPATARAQNAVDALAPPPPAQDVVGPAQLQNFTLNGTVTRRADPEPASPQPRRPAQAQAEAASSAGRPATTRPEAPRSRTAATVPGQAPGGSTAAAAVPSAQAALPSLTTVPAPEPAFSPAVEPAAMPATEGGALGEGFGPLPWLLAALAAAAAGFFLWRQRKRPRPAYAGAGMAFDAQPEAAPPAAAPPAPRWPGSPVADTGPRLSPSGGIVSSRIRPWLEIDFTPARCIYSDTGAVIEFEVTVLNSGAAPAREVLLETRLFNSGEAQDEEVGAFFAHPHGQGNRIPEIPPLKSVSVKSAVSLTREQLRAYRLEERLLWVPTIGFTALYRWSGGQGQTSASFILGRETKGDKMAAFRLDQGARVFRGLGARPHTVGVRI